MSEVASLKSSQRLYKVSRWGATGFKWCYTDKIGYFLFRVDHPNWKSEYYKTEAYELGEVLQRLPRKIDGKSSRERTGTFSLYASVRSRTAWVASYVDDDTVIRRRKVEGEKVKWRYVQSSAETPEDAVCGLAILLFELGILEGTS